MVNNITGALFSSGGNLTMVGNMTWVEKTIPKLPWWNKSILFSWKDYGFLALRVWTLIALVLLLGIIGFLIYKFAKRGKGE